MNEFTPTVLRCRGFRVAALRTQVIVPVFPLRTQAFYVHIHVRQYLHHGLAGILTSLVIVEAEIYHIQLRILPQTLQHRVDGRAAAGHIAVLQPTRRIKRDVGQQVDGCFKNHQLLIGATVVSIGTTLPEVMVSTTSALTGHGEIAYGNAIGSVICNAALIAAITIAVRPGKVDPKSLRTPVAFFFVAAAFYAGVAYTTGSFTRPVGLILLAMFVAYIVCNVLAMKNAPAPEEEEQAEEGSFAKELGLLAIGAVLIAVGADLLVDNGTLIAQALGVPESVIALTFVALGTSLPELVTAITSLAKGHGALSLGNVIGANVFNLVLVSGMSITVSPFSIPQNSTIRGINSSLVMDLPVMFAVMLLLTVPALLKGRLSRWQGVLLLCIYAAFCAIQFTM